MEVMNKFLQSIFLWFMLHVLDVAFNQMHSGLNFNEFNMY